MPPYSSTFSELDRLLWVRTTVQNTDYDPFPLNPTVCLPCGAQISLVRRHTSEIFSWYKDHAIPTPPSEALESVLSYGEVQFYNLCHFGRTSEMIDLFVWQHGRRIATVMIDE
jgi:hypothetical protein